MNKSASLTNVKYRRSKEYYNIGFASYELMHHSFQRHFHEHYVIELVTSGADKFYCNNRMQTATADDVVLINPYEVHTGSTIGDIRLHYYSLSPSSNQLKQLAELLERSLPTEFNFQNSISSKAGMANKMHSFFLALESVYASDLHCEELFFDLMNELFNSACSNINRTFSTNIKDKRVQLLLQLMNDSFAKPLSLKQMAEHVLMSPYHLIRIFKSATGLSPYEYLLVLRTEYAKRLLGKGFNVQDAALKSGFYDASHFNRTFRKVEATMPKTFRLSKQ